MVLVILNREDTRYVVLDQYLQQYLVERFGPDYGYDFDYQVAVRFLLPVYVVHGRLMVNANTTSGLRTGCNLIPQNTLLK